MKTEKKVTLSIRWQGGATEIITADIPLNNPDRWRASPEIVERISKLSVYLQDKEIATVLNDEGQKTNKGNSYTESIVRWIRFKNSISTPLIKRKGELGVKEVAKKFNVSAHVVYYWIECKTIAVRRDKKNGPLWIILDKETEDKLFHITKTSSRLAKIRELQNQIA